MEIRKLQKARVYKGQRRVYRIFICSVVSMMITSLILNLLGFYWLISSHVDQAVRMSKIKNLQILAQTLAQQKIHEISLKGQTSWMYANMISEYVDDPNPDFMSSLKHEISEVVENQNSTSGYSLQTNNGSSYDLYNNQFAEEGRLLCDKIEALGNNAVLDKSLANNDKQMWYILPKSLPEVIANDPRVQRDITTCSAITALMTRPMYSLLPPFEEDEYKYIETTYSGFDDSAVFCEAPLEYKRYIHKSLKGTGITGYSCPASNLPFTEFPGWDDDQVYNPLCRGWYIS